MLIGVVDIVDNSRDNPLEKGAKGGFEGHFELKICRWRRGYGII